MKNKEFTSENLRTENPCWKGYKAVGTKKKSGKTVPNCVPTESVDEAANAAQQAAIAIAIKKKKGMSESYTTEDDIEEDITEGELYRILELSGLINEDVELQFDKIEEWVESLAEAHGVDSEVIWEDFETVTDSELLSEAAAWQKSSGKNKNGGLNQKGVNSYKREHPGSKLKTAVTTKPSKLKPGGKAAKRRKSFCARMSGMKKSRTSAKTAHDPNSRINKSLRKWNC